MSDRPKVLIVDSVAGNVQLLESILEERFLVEKSMSGDHASILIQAESKPDLILIDTTMPKVDGYSICSALMNNPITKDIPIILMGARLGDGGEHKARCAGSVDYIARPIVPAIVRYKVKKHLSRYYKSCENVTVLGLCSCCNDYYAIDRAV